MYTEDFTSEIKHLCKLFERGVNNPYNPDRAAGAMWFVEELKYQLWDAEFSVVNNLPSWVEAAFANNQGTTPREVYQYAISTKLQKMEREDFDFAGLYKAMFVEPSEAKAIINRVNSYINELDYCLEYGAFGDGVNSGILSFEIEDLSNDGKAMSEAICKENAFYLLSLVESSQPLYRIFLKRDLPSDMRKHINNYLRTISNLKDMALKCDDVCKRFIKVPDTPTEEKNAPQRKERTPKERPSFEDIVCDIYKPFATSFVEALKREIEGKSYKNIITLYIRVAQLKGIIKTGLSAPDLYFAIVNGFGDEIITKPNFLSKSRQIFSTPSIEKIVEEGNFKIEDITRAKEFVTNFIATFTE